jgi:DNA-binding phage protein
MSDLAMLQQKYELLRPHLNELGLRMCAAADALVLGRGGISAISKASHLSRTTIYAGLSELKKTCPQHKRLLLGMSENLAVVAND